MTEVYYHIVQSFEEYDEEKLFPLVSESQLVNIKRYVFKEDRIRSFIGKRLLDIVFGSKVGDRLVFTKYGKPLLPGEKNFSISHSGNIVALAVSDNKVGIDIEQCLPTDIQAFLPYFSENEKYLLNSADDRVKSFFSIWTKKEAILKAKSIGINDYMKNLDTCSQQEYNLIEMNLSDSYICHLAHQHTNYEIKKIDFTMLSNLDLQTPPSNLLR